MSSGSGALRRPCGGPLGPAGAYFLATLALLGVFRVHAALHLDTARDLLLARDCVVGVRCSGAGPRSSFGGWTQGALWSHLLELRELLGLGLAALEHAANLSLALAAALVPLTARALGRPATALTWALWFPATLLAIAYPTLWNPTLWPLVLGLFHLALAHAVRARGLPSYAAAAAALALAVDVHVASAVLVPSFVAVVVGCAARPVLAALASAGVAVAVHLVDSPGAFADNRELVVRHAPAIALALALAAATGLALRRRAAMTTPATIARALCIYLLVALPLLAFVAGHPLHIRYLAPLVTPAAILLGARAPDSARLRASAVALACAAYLAFWLNDRAYNPRLRLVEAEPVAAALYARGLSFGDLFLRLRGPHAYDLLSTLAALEPPGHRSRAADDRDLLVFRTARADLPALLPTDWTLVDLGPHVAVIAAYHPRVRLDPLAVCRAPADSQHTTCTTLRLDPAAFAQHAGMRWADRAHAGIPGLARPGRGERISYHMTVRPAPGPARRVRLFADECKGWRIGDGAQVVDLPAGATDPLVFTVTASPRCRGWLPPFAELADPALERLLPPLPGR